MTDGLIIILLLLAVIFGVPLHASLSARSQAWCGRSGGAASGR